MTDYEFVHNAASHIIETNAKAQGVSLCYAVGNNSDRVFVFHIKAGSCYNCMLRSLASEQNAFAVRPSHQAFLC